MTDIVTRLLALAVKMKDRSRHITYDDVDEGAEALREAADTFVSVFKAWEEERDALKAKLAEAEAEAEDELDDCNRRALSYFDRAEKAEAEAAALREAGNALVPFLPDISYGIAAKHSSHQQAVMAFKAALSQPGPGAAYQERLGRAEALIKAVFTPGTVTEEQQRIYDEWAALEETP